MNAKTIKENGLRGEIYSGPDSEGRYHYGLFWLADYHPGHPEGEYRRAERGQHFFGVPPNDGRPWTDLKGRK
jgi:hypothetical protein